MLDLQVGQYGGLQDEIENLKRDKNVLMMELVRMRNAQQVRQQQAQVHHEQPTVVTRCAAGA